MFTVDFKFAPLDLVTVTAYALNLQGRVVGCGVQPGGIKTVEVEYASSGEIHKRLFYEDEVAERNGDHRR